MAAAHPVRARDEDGLMLVQRRLLSALAAGQEAHEACRDEGITWSRFRGWIDKDEAFLTKYNALFGSTPGTAKSMLDMMAVKAVNVVDDALAATRLQAVEVTCESCSQVTTGYVDVADFQKQKWAAEYVGKASEVLKDVSKTDVTVTHKLGLEDKIALQRAKRKMSIPPHMLERFQQQGLLPEGDAVEAEFQEVTGEESA